MKYKLAKDLPYEKAGTEILLDESGFFYTQGEGNYIGVIQDKDRLIKDGWIEEVKPREWFLVASACFHKKEYAEAYKEDVLNECEPIIKVREVIE